MLKRLVLGLGLGVALAVGACSPTATYVAADRLTYEVVAPIFLRYVEGDATLTLDERNRRAALIHSWELRIRKAEGVQ